MSELRPISKSQAKRLAVQLGERCIHVSDGQMCECTEEHDENSACPVLGIAHVHEPGIPCPTCGGSGEVCASKIQNDSGDTCGCPRAHNCHGPMFGCPGWEPSPCPSNCIDGWAPVLTTH